MTSIHVTWLMYTCDTPNAMGCTVLTVQPIAFGVSFFQMHSKCIYTRDTPNAVLYSLDCTLSSHLMCVRVRVCERERYEWRCVCVWEREIWLYTVITSVVRACACAWERERDVSGDVCVWERERYDCTLSPHLLCVRVCVRERERCVRERETWVEMRVYERERYDCTLSLHLLCVRVCVWERERDRRWDVCVWEREIWLYTLITFIVCACACERERGPWVEMRVCMRERDISRDACVCERERYK